MSTTKLDIVIPLGNGSKFDNLELRFALRSIANNVVNLGKIWILTEYTPEWLTNVEIVKAPDLFTDNKDANLFTKILQACDIPELTEKFIFWSDDQAILKPLCRTKWPILTNCRGPNLFNGNGKWSKRMLHTFKYLSGRGHELNCNYDCHSPQLYSKTLFKELITKTPFRILPGFCINTLYFGLQNNLRTIDQFAYKDTFEGKQYNPSFRDIHFIGYDDNAFITGVRELLKARFPDKCIYEKE